MNYIKSAINELRNNVNWTKRNELQRLTVLVAVFCILFSLAIWGVDTGFSRLVTLYYQFIN